MRALADAAQLAHPDIPWTPPPRLPTAHDLRQALEILTPPPADARTLAACLAALVIAFEPNTKLSPEAMRLRFEVWKEAVSDLGGALLHEATTRAIKVLRWMPKPAEVREQVRADLEAQARRRDLCRRMLRAIEGKPVEPEKPLATRMERLKHTRSIYAGWGDRPSDVERIDREIARETARDRDDAA